MHDERPFSRIKAKKNLDHKIAIGGLKVKKVQRSNEPAASLVNASKMLTLFGCSN